MSLATDSPLHSSSSGSDDFAAFLNDELDSYSDTSPEAEEEDDDYGSDNARVKRQKVDILESVKDPQSSALQNVEQIIESRAKELCSHPGSIRGMCLRCGEKVDDDDDSGVANHGSTVALKYIHKDLRLGNDEIARLRNRDFKNLLRHKKLYLVLDLDHTLLNSTRFQDIVQDEEYLMSQAGSLQDASTSRGSLFRLDFMRMATKLRPFVHTFLKEASSLFEMYIYTMGERAYALEMAKLLDPEKVYFSSRVIAQDDCTQRHQKGLDVVLGQESAVLILDDTESVWSKHRENLILMERYHYFASSCRQFGFKSESLSQRKTDENESDGALASILKVLKQIHSMFFDTEPGVDFADRDVRQVMSSVRKEILKGCKVVFSGVFPTNDDNIAERHHLWKIAERMGAMCVKEVDPSVTHVISIDAGTEKSRWAVKQKKFLVNPVWIEAANYFWEKKPEDNFPVVNHPKKSQ